MSRDNECEVCGAKPGDECANTIRPGVPLPMGRREHFARALPPDHTRQRRNARQKGTL